MPNNLVEKFLGRPFREGEWDCYNLILEWFKELGHELPDYRHESYWQGEKVGLEDYFKFWRRLNEGEIPRENDGIFMKNIFTANSRYHMGIYLGDGTMLHCCKEGVVRERVKKYQRVIEGYYRLRAIDAN